MAVSWSNEQNAKNTSSLSSTILMPQPAVRAFIRVQLTRILGQNLHQLLAPLPLRFGQLIIDIEQQFLGLFDLLLGRLQSSLILRHSGLRLLERGFEFGNCGLSGRECGFGGENEGFFLGQWIYRRGWRGGGVGFEGRERACEEGGGCESGEEDFGNVDGRELVVNVVIVVVAAKDLEGRCARHAGEWGGGKRVDAVASEGEDG